MSFLSSFSESGQPPTPTRTPTSATFGSISFETPKQESSFYDPRVTWNTADPCATSPDFLKTPKQLSFATPTQSPIIKLDRKRPLSVQNIENEIASHVHHPSPNPNLSLPPVELSRQLSSSPNPSSSSSTKGSGSKQASTPLKIGLVQDTETSMRSASSMQTPPPTSTSASRRKAQRVQTVKPTKQSSANSRRMSTPTFAISKNVETMGSHIEESPLQLSSIQFSPEGFGFPTSGPATAPTYPQNKLFWDPDQNTDGMNIDFPTDDPFPFGDRADKGLDPFISSIEKQAGSQLPLSPSFDDFSTNNTQDIDLAMSAIQSSANQADLLPTGLMIQCTSKGVDPSLLFSSPGHSSVPSAAASLIINDTLQPYANQIRDAQIERELSLDRKAKRRRKVQDDSPAVKAALQVLRDENDICADIKRNATDNVTPQLRTGRSTASRVTFRTHEKSRRDSSTKKSRSLKRHQQSVQESRKRTAVTLTIDENGRAKTETKPVLDEKEEKPEENMDTCDVSEESDSSSSVESEEMTLSQPQSFAFPDPQSRKPKSARFATDSQAHSQKSSYASTFGTSNTTYSLSFSEKTARRRRASEMSGSNYRRSSQANHRLHRALSSTTISDDMDDSNYEYRNAEIQNENETVTTSDDDKGDAQSELKKIIRNRTQNETTNRSALRKSSQGQRQAYASFGEQLPANVYGKSVSYSQGGAGNTIDDISPTTLTDPDLATPSTSNGSHASDSTRCVCHMSEIEGELMILW